MMITLQQIRDAGPCESGWRKLNKALGNPNMTREISIGDVVLSNGLDDALWCLRFLPRRQQVAAVMPSVRRASAHTSDHRVHECIADIDRWLAGDASVDMRAARAAARSAAFAAAEAASWAARAAAFAAAEAAPWAARAAASATEREQQRRDLLDMFPPLVLTEGKAK